MRSCQRSRPNLSIVQFSGCHLYRSIRRPASATIAPKLYSLYDEDIVWRTWGYCMRQHRSFFGSVKSHFRDDVAGRYLARILREVLTYEPELATAFEGLTKQDVAAIRSGEYQVVVELPLSNHRSADLALKSTTQPDVLMEFKVEDQRKGDWQSQLKAYKNYASRKPDTRFLYVTRYSPSAEEKKLLTGWKTLEEPKNVLFSQLWGKLKGRSNSSSLSAMLTHYLEEEGMSGYQPISEASAKDYQYLLRSLLPIESDHGMGRLTAQDRSIKSAPEIMRLLVANARVLATWLKESNPDAFPGSITSESKVYPYFNGRALLKHIAAEASKARSKNWQYRPSGKACTGGVFEAIARLHMQGGKAKKIFCEIRLELELDDKRVSSCVGVGFGGGDLDAGADCYSYEEVKKDFSAPESRICSLVNGCLKEAKTKAANATTSKATSSALTSLKFSHT